MEHFFHPGPPFVGGAVGERLLARFADGPPLLGGGVGGNVRHVGGEVRADVFEIGEQVMPSVVELAQIDRVVLDVALADLLQHGGPDGGVELLVFVEFLGLQADHHAVAFHRLDWEVGLGLDGLVELGELERIPAVLAHKFHDIIIRSSVNVTRHRMV